MIKLDCLEELAQLAVEWPVGCEDPFLESLEESWAPFRRFLYLVVAEYKPAVVVECGVNRGTTTGHMASACFDTHVIGIDLKYHPDAYVVARNYPNITLIHGDTKDIDMLQKVRWLCKEDRIGLIFLDSTHNGATPQAEFNLYCQLFADECIVAVDDLLGPEHLRKLMSGFWDWLPGEKLELNFLHPVPETHVGLIDQPGFGISVVRKDD